MSALIFLSVRFKYTLLSIVSFFSVFDEIVALCFTRQLCEGMPFEILRFIWEKTSRSLHHYTRTSIDMKNEFVIYE